MDKTNNNLINSWGNHNLIKTSITCNNFSKKIINNFRISNISHFSNYLINNPQRKWITQNKVDI